MKAVAYIEPMKVEVQDIDYPGPELLAFQPMCIEGGATAVAGPGGGAAEPAPRVVHPPVERVVIDARSPRATMQRCLEAQ